MSERYQYKDIKGGSYQYKDIEEKRNSIKDIFSKYFIKLQKCFDRCISTKVVETDRLVRELVPFMYVISDIAAIQTKSNRKYISDTFKDNCYTPVYSYYYDKRINLYIQFINGKQPCYEWMLFEKPKGEENGILRCCAALGDILINPERGNDYDNAPTIVRGRKPNYAFVDGMSKFVELTMELYKEFCDEYSSNPEFRNVDVQKSEYIGLSYSEKKELDDEQWRKWKFLGWAAFILLIIIGLIVFKFN